MNLTQMEYAEKRLRFPFHDLLSFRRHALHRLPTWRPSRRAPSRSRQRPL